MHQPEGWGPRRPIDVPIMVAAEGPKGLEVARLHGDGVSTFVNAAPPEFDWIMRLVFGTVLLDGEANDSDRVVGTVDPIAGLGYHATYEWQGPEAVRDLPNGDSWLEAARAVPEAQRHLAIHDGHGIVVNNIDRKCVPREFCVASIWVGSTAELRKKVEQLAAEGVTEVTYQPGGTDLERELRSFSQVSFPTRT